MPNDGAGRRLTAPDMTHSLDRLSDRERELLRLLAQGHTAKTIARSRSLTVNVVNEHLRSARRKTGAPSSRELARLVVGEPGIQSQETRDNLLGLESTTGPEHRTPDRGVAARAIKTLVNRRVAMTLGVLILAGVLAYQTSVITQAEQPDATEQQKASVPAASVRPDVIYQVLFSADDEIIGSPTVVGQFGREVRVEISDLMRVTMFTGERDQDGKFYTSARMQLFRNNAWQPAGEMSMRSSLAFTPSFEHSVEGTPYRFVVMPRLIVPATE